MRRYLTSDDIQASAAAALFEMMIDSETVVTDVAREVASRLGVRLVEAPAGGVSAGGPAGGSSGGGSSRSPTVIIPQRADLLIKNGTVIIPGHGEITADVAVLDGRILALTQHDGRSADSTIDATGLHVLPGLIDPHIHLGIFGPLEQEFATETLSALAGGVTTVGCMVGAAGRHRDTVAQWQRLVAERSWTDLVPHLVISQEEQLEELVEIGRRHGIRSFKVYMAGIEGLFDAPDDGFLLEAARRVRAVSEDAILMIHCENQTLVKRATQRLRAQSPEHLTLAEWSEARPPLAEAEAIQRAGTLAQAAGVRPYFVHVTSSQGLAAARTVKTQYARTIIETCSPYLSIATDSDLGPLAKMVPPFRDPASREALWQGVLDRTIDLVGTDHVAQSLAVKSADKGMWGAMPGYQMLGLHLAVLLHEGYHRRGIPLVRLVEAVTKTPAEVFGLYPHKGGLLPGSDADIVLVNLSEERTVNAHDLHSWSDFSLYDGKRLKGWPVMTIKGGVPVIRDGRAISGRPASRLITRGLFATG